MPRPLMRDRLKRLVGSDRWRLGAVCLALNVAVLAGIALRYPAYLSDFRLNDNPDAKHYVQLGRNLLLEGHYSRTEGPPYPPDFLRTPVYPLFSAALDIAVGPAGIYLAQVAIQVGIVLMLYRLAGLYFGRRAAFWAALLGATDLMSATYNFSALTEPLYSGLTLVALTLLVPRLAPPESSDDAGAGHGPGAYLAIGVLLALATLTRPAGLYLPGVMALVALGLLGRRRGWRPAARAACLLLLPSVVLVGGWILRNHRQFGVARISSVDAVGTVYMAGAGAYQVHHGISRPEAQERISAEFGLPTLLEVQNPWLSSLGIREMDARLRRAAPDILTKYPGALLVSTLVGLVKGSLSHNVPDLARLHGRSWTPPVLGDLARLRGPAFGRLVSNDAALVGAFLWQVGHAVLTLALAAAGLWRLLRSSAWRPLGVVLLLTIAYLGAGMALFGVDAYYRSRLPMLPYLYLLAGLAASRLHERLAGRIGELRATRRKSSR